MRIFILAAAISTCAPAVAQTAFDGGYAGVVAGVQAHNSRNARTEGTAAFLTLTPGNAPANLRLDYNDGWQGGLVAGWNASAGNLVYGVEADLIFGNVTGSAAFSGAPIAGLAPAGLTTSASQRLGTRGSLRARLGTMAGEKTLIYATGGLAVGDVRSTADVVVNGAPTVAWSGVRETTRAGWTVGGGAEFKLTSAVSLRGEYLYTDLGRQSVLAAGNSGVRGISALNGIDYQAGLPTRGGTARIGAIVKF